jgi:hypothetical protein
LCLWRSIALGREAFHLHREVALREDQQRQEVYRSLPLSFLSRQTLLLSLQKMKIRIDLEEEEPARSAWRRLAFAGMLVAGGSPEFSSNQQNLV